MNAVSGHGIQRLCRLARSCSSCDTTDDVGTEGIDAALDLFDADAAIMARVQNGRFVPLAAHTTTLYTGAYHNREDGLAGQTLDEGESIIVDDLQTDPRAKPTNDRHHSVLSVPFGEGVFQVFTEESETFSEADAETAELLCAVVQQALERVESEQESEQERDRLAALFDNLPDPAVRCSHRVEEEDPVIEEVNSAFVDLFEYDASRIAGDSLVETVVPDDVETPIERERGGRDAEYTEHEVERKTASGTRPFLLRRVPITQTANQAYFIYTDIAPLKRRERELQRQNERLDRFADVVSHDLRNPLSVAEGYLDLIDRTEDNADALDTIEDALDRMNTIIEDTLAMARQGQPVQETSSVAIADVAQSAWESVVTEDATLDVGGDVEVEADDSRLRQLFENLFRNAIEHVGSDVTVEIGPLDERHGFYVADDGPGIPPGKRDQIFEAGYSAPTGSDSGTGLGLAIVSEIAEAHGWEVAITEHHTGGARFEFETSGTAQPSMQTAQPVAEE